MNQQEMKELRRQFKKNNNDFFITHITLAYAAPIPGGNEIRSLQTRFFEDLPEDEQEIYLSLLKKVFSGKIGRNLMEYSFEATVDGSNTYQQKLYALNQSRLRDEAQVKEFVETFAEHCGYGTPFYLMVAACEYAAPQLGKDGKKLDGGTPTHHRFLAAVANEVALTEIGLFFNEKDQQMEKKEDEDMHVLPKLLDGFLYPVFTDRSSDVNHILFYTKNPKEPNGELIQALTGEEAIMPHTEEKAAFSRLLDDVAQEELSFQLVKQIHGTLRDMVQENEDNEAFEMSRKQMKEMLADCGISEQRMKRFDAAYDQFVEDVPLHPINMVDTDKMDISMEDIKVTVKKDAAYRLKTQVVDGRRYLMIEMPEGMMIDGLDIIK